MTVNEKLQQIIDFFFRILYFKLVIASGFDALRCKTWPWRAHIMYRHVVQFSINIIWMLLENWRIMKIYHQECETSFSQQYACGFPN